MDSSYIVRYYDSFLEQGDLHIIMEFCNRGDLSDLLRTLQGEGALSLPHNDLWSLFLSVTLGLHCIHSQRVLHRDIKSSNVFLHQDEATGHCTVKIGDLGVSRLLETTRAYAETVVGTPYYLSPELCE
ncbi:unnamed protein product, partial [Discosporangium mesarthrocarpum]